ncbi:MAG: HAMP domain-containing sensor histidine kinase [Hyphomonadaceae bacterium]
MLRTVDSYLQLPRRRYFSALEVHAAIIGSIAAVVVLIGYGFNVEAIQSLIPGFPTMKLRTASSLMALSLGYLLSLRNSEGARRGAIAGAAAVLALMLYSIAAPPEFIPGDPWSITPSLATLYCLAACALALLVILLTPRFAMLAGVLALAAAAPATFRIIGLALFAGAPDPTSPMNTMALHTSVLTAWFSLVCLILHPRLPFGRALLQPSLRGRLLRRALPFGVLLPISASALSFSLHVLFAWSDEVLFAFSAAFNVVIGALLIWWLSSVAENWQREANAQAARLSRANEALEQYASSAAHDLKAPVRHVLLYGELLQEAMARGDPATALRHAKSIRDSALDLPGMIDGMLDYSRSAFMRISITETSLSELIQTAVAQLASDLQTAGGSVRVLTEARLRCDSTLMTTVFQNLISNAIKSRRRDRPLEIKIGCANEDGLWRIVVEDNGAGFDPDFAAVAFNPLARGVHVAGDGAGIGLATCRNIIQSHGGEIQIDATFRGGARIVFTLPENPQAKT